MTKEEIDSSRFTTMRVFRIESGWVVESKEADLHPKTNAYDTPAKTLIGMLDWYAKAGVGAANMRKIQSLKKTVAEVFGE